MKKKVFLAAIITVAAITLVIATVLTTMAFLTASTAVSNTFTVGNISIEMFESHVDASGKKDPTTVGQRKSSYGNNYHLVPGKTYDKDPTVYVLPNGEPCYLFIKLRNQIATFEEKHTTTDVTSNTMSSQMLENGWVLIGTTSTGDIYAYKGSAVEGDIKLDQLNTVVASKIAPQTHEQQFDVFDTFTVEHDITSDELAKAKGSKVTLTAYAIQTDGFTTITDGQEIVGRNEDVIDAWNAICDEIPYENAGLNYSGTEDTDNNPATSDNAAPTPEPAE